MVKSVYYFVNVILFLLCTATGQVSKIHGFKNAKDVGGGGELFNQSVYFYILIKIHICFKGLLRTDLH